MYQKLRQFRFEYVVTEKALLMPANAEVTCRYEAESPEIVEGRQRNSCPVN